MNIYTFIHGPSTGLRARARDPPSPAILIRSLWWIGKHPAYFRKVTGAAGMWKTLHKECGKPLCILPIVNCAHWVYNRSTLGRKTDKTREEQKIKEHGSETFYFEELANHFIMQLQDRGIPYSIEEEDDYESGFHCIVTIVRW